MKVTIKKNETPLEENIEVREIKVRDTIKAQAVSGKSEGLEYMLAVLAEIATFDGKKKQMEDLLDMSADDFFLLQEGLIAAGLETMSEQLSSAKNSEDSQPTT